MMWERRIPVSFQLFLGVNSPITGPILEGPRGRFKQRKSRISATPKLGDFWRAYPTLRTPAQTLRSRAHLQDYRS